MKSINILLTVFLGILTITIGSNQLTYAELDGTIGQENANINRNLDNARTNSLELIEPQPIGVTFFGNGGYSADGSGTAENLLKVEVPAGSTIEQAYLYFSLPSFPNSCPATKNVTFEGQVLTLNKLPTDIPTDFGCAYRTEVTSQVAAKVGPTGGITEFPVSGFSSNGVGLVAIYSNPASPEVSIAIMDGRQNTSGDNFLLGLSKPLDKNIPGFSAIMSLGIGHGYQGAAGDACGTGSQYSTVDVNGQRLTSCAGNYDDGRSLITIGGVGDSTDNPSDPFEQPGQGSGTDDELYNIAPFLKNGDTQISIDTKNPSNDDIIFLAVIQITAQASVGEICGDGIDNDEDGQIDEGCAPPDRDGDGVPDSDDACPDEFAETDDGCPLQCVEAEQINAFFDFNNGAPDEASGIITTESVRDYDQDGFDGDMLRNTSGGNPQGTPGEKTIIQLTNLPEHDSVNISFLLAIIATWDGNTPCCEPDYFNVIVDGQEIFKETFAHPNKVASYNPPEGVLITLHENRGFHPWDQSYNMGNDPAFQNIPHTSDTLTIEFFADGAGWQGGGDESWGIDNLQITTNLSEPICEVPEPQETKNGGDNQWDTRPTFGISHEDRANQVVDSGFSFNGEFFTLTDNHHTDFAEQSVDIGTTNSFSAKVYADKKLKVQEFLFGIPNVGEAHLAELGVEVWYDRDGNIEDVKVVQKSDVIDAETVSVSHEKTKCLPTDPEPLCDTTTVSMTFLEPLADKVMAIKAIDYALRDQRTFLNEGFDISGDSLNPMASKMIPSNQRNQGLIEVTQLAKYSPYWQSDDGRLFEMNSFGSFKQVNQSFERFADTGDARTRLHSGFGGILQYEQNRATQVFDSSKLISDLPDSFGYHFEMTERLNEDIMQKIYEQQEIAKEILKEMDKQNRYY